MRGLERVVLKCSDINEFMWSQIMQTLIILEVIKNYKIGKQLHMTGKKKMCKYVQLENYHI